MMKNKIILFILFILSDFLSCTKANFIGYLLDWTILMISYYLEHGFTYQGSDVAS